MLIACDSDWPRATVKFQGIGSSLLVWNSLDSVCALGEMNLETGYVELSWVLKAETNTNLVWKVVVVKIKPLGLSTLFSAQFC